MKFKKLIFLLALLGILLLIIITQNLSKITETEINQIYFSEDKITIITTSNQTLILFSASQIDLKEEDEIEFTGSPSSYRGKEQIIINKIWKIKLNK